MGVVEVCYPLGALISFQSLFLASSQPPPPYYHLIWALGFRNQMKSLQFYCML